MNIDVTSDDIRFVRMLARKYVDNINTEDDLLQEGLLALIRAHKTFDDKKNAKFETYATHVITNRFIDIMRKNKPADIKYDDDIIPNTTSFDDEQRIAEVKRALRDHVDDLDRAIFNSYIEGFSYAEIGKIFDLSPKKIDNTVQKVKRIIASKIC